jgi:hypothetical protein
LRLIFHFLNTAFRCISGHRPLNEEAHKLPAALTQCRAKDEARFLWDGGLVASNSGPQHGELSPTQHAEPAPTPTSLARPP